ncbi:MAG: fasciclin domain-containing protein [Pirellulales bacterium]|nr:fasciclin domain-containing protein [Pirellulales bacterium]
MKTFLRGFLFLAACGLTAVHCQAADIVETAVKAGKFKTLATALDAADLVKTLSGPGPFTVFAPTDEAFAKLPAGTVEMLVKPENKGKLTSILTYHVVPGKVTSSEVVELSGAKTVNGQRIDIKVAGGKVMVDGATVTATDIKCDNGVIHIIDSVIMPADKNLVEVAQQAGTFNTLIAAAKAAGLAGALTGDEPLTVFAPTDEAFKKLPAGTVESLLKPENKQGLADLLKYHVVAGRVYSEDAVKAKAAKTLQGSSVNVSVGKEGARINQSKLLKTDLDASNGVIHVIDAVLMPPIKRAEARAMIEQTVAHGSKLFNAGHHDACARTYSETMGQLAGADMPPSLKHYVSEVMTVAKHQHCPTARAWTLRHGLDHAYEKLAQSH